MVIDHRTSSDQFAVVQADGLDALAAVTGVERIGMLYLQLLYRCNFACRHCFHGERLAWRDSFSLKEAVDLLAYFVERFELGTVCLLGGEPLLYPEIVPVARAAKELGLTVDLCSNGHSAFSRRLVELAPYLDRLRVSIDGLAATHDAIRQAGSFASALRTLELARESGIPTGVTTTVTAHNVDEIAALARLVEERGARDLTLHCLRRVGNAAGNPDLAVAEQQRYAEMHAALASAGLRLQVKYDSDLGGAAETESCSPTTTRFLDRIEVDPRGALTMSCKAVGKDAHAFRWDRHGRTVHYEPTASDELQLHIPDVLYVT
jgi:MoaA/NifB/PqqE/SkfB family radical SAM enzyme